MGLVDEEMCLEIANKMEYRIWNEIAESVDAIVTKNVRTYMSISMRSEVERSAWPVAWALDDQDAIQFDYRTIGIPIGF